MKIINYFLVLFFLMIQLDTKSNNAVYVEIQIDSLYNICCEQIENNEVSAALLGLKKIKNDFKNSIDSYTFNKIQLKYAEAFIIINEYEKALEVLYNALDNTKDSIKDFTIAEMYNKTGWVNLELNSYDNAKRYFYKAQKTMPDSMKYSARMASIYNNLGIVYHKQASYQEALFYYKKALNIFGKLKDLHGLSIGEINTGIINFKNGKLNESQAAFEQALIYAKNSHKKSDKIVAYINLGKVANKRFQYSKAISYFEVALMESRKIEDKRLERKSLYGLSVSYEFMQDWRYSLKYFKLFSQIKDSIFDQEMASKFAEMQTRFETHQKEQENKNLRTEKAYQLEKIETKNKLLFFSLLLIFSLAIFGIVFFIQKRNQFNANKALLKKNIEIVKSEKVLNETKTSLEKKIQSLENNRNNSGQKYESSSLSENKKEKLFYHLQTLMENEKLFTDPNISTSIFATKLNTNKNYISQVINEFHKSNFNHFINEYRIKEARELLSNNNLNKYTIEAIGNMVGFKSKSSFYQAFKKFTGLTPSFYINNIGKI